MFHFFPHFISRRHAITFRKCAKELGDTPCRLCQKNPHTIHEDVLKDLPRRDLGDGALFWDLQEDPNNPGHLEGV